MNCYRRSEEFISTSNADATIVADTGLAITSGLIVSVQKLCENV